MKNLEGQGIRGAIGAILGLLLLLSLLLLVPTVWLVVVFNAKFRTCVQLDNGLNLGYEAVFDLSSPYFMPIAVPRFANGTPLLRDDMWSIYVTDTTIYGWALGLSSEEDYDYAWRADTGLILKNDFPRLYEKLVAEAGHANWDIGTGSIGTGWLLHELIERPEFDVKLCPTSLITW